MEKPSTDMYLMPITPRHQQAIDEILERTHARVHILAVAIGYGDPPTLTLDLLQQSILAKQLRVIARYAEGYDLSVQDPPGSILENIRQVAQLLFPKSSAQPGYQFPPGFHKMPLGEIVHAALARHHPREKRMTVGEVMHLLGVTRQSVHSWVEGGDLMPIFDAGTLTLFRPQVESFQRKREQRNKA